MAQFCVQWQMPIKIKELRIQQYNSIIRIKIAMAQFGSVQWALGMEKILILSLPESLRKHRFLCGIRFDEANIPVGPQILPGTRINFDTVLWFCHVNSNA